MFKQPRVPEFRESEGVGKHLKALTLFLKDFCQDAWVASGQAHKSIDAIHYPVTSVNGETGDVQLDTIANADDAKKLGGKEWRELLLELHPVGSLYLSMDDISPADLFGGDWEKLENYFLMAASEEAPAGSTGGEAEHVHALTQAYAGVGYSETEEGGWVEFDPSGVAFSASAYAGPTEYAEVEAEGAYEVPTGVKLHGDTDAASNIPPYMAVNVWLRTA